MTTNYSWLAILMLLVATPSQASFDAELDAIFDAHQGSEPGCSVAAARNGKTLFSKGYGRANLEHLVPITADTRFYAGSVSKQFTAAAVAVLVDQGKITLSDSIHQYIPELPDYTQDITISHLIHHTSGLRDHLSLMVLAGIDFLNSKTSTEVIALLARQRGTNFQPGTQQLYSNSGYFLLAELVKRITGQTLDEFAHQHFFEPYGMSQTHFHEDHTQLIPKRAEDYIKSDAGWTTGRPRTALVGAGGLYTTVADLLLWNEALFKRKSTLKKTLLKKGVLNSGEEITYAFGLLHAEHRGLKTIGHNGALVGYRANLVHYPDQAFSLALLCNSSQANVGLLSRQIAELILEEHMNESDAPSAAEAVIDADTLDRLVGLYALRPNFKIDITRKEERLFAQATGQPKFEVFASSANKYFYKVVDAQLTFDVRADGPAQSLTLHQNGANMPAAREEGEHQFVRPLQDFAGDYYSVELDVTATLFVEGNELWSQPENGEQQKLERSSENGFNIGGVVIQTSSGLDNRIQKLHIDLPRAQGIEYVRQSQTSKPD